MMNKTDEHSRPATEATEGNAEEVTQVAEDTKTDAAKETGQETAEKADAGKKADAKKKADAGKKAKADKEADAPLSELEQLRKDLTEAKEQYLRLAAEYDNFRKRTAKEKESLYSDAKAASFSAMLPVLDNLERAFAAEVSGVEDLKKGVEMTRDQLQSTFKSAGVEAFGEVGDAFDPNLHNAVMHGEEESLGTNVVAEVFQKGYKMGDRILRHAMVKVVN